MHERQRCVANNYLGDSDFPVDGILCTGHTTLCGDYNSRTGANNHGITNSDITNNGDRSR